MFNYFNDMDHIYKESCKLLYKIWKDYADFQWKWYYESWKCLRFWKRFPIHIQSQIDTADSGDEKWKYYPDELNLLLAAYDRPHFPVDAKPGYDEMYSLVDKKAKWIPENFMIRYEDDRSEDDEAAAKKDLEFAVDSYKSAHDGMQPK